MTQPLANKHILLGVTGSIATYKAATLTRLLIKAGATVQVLMTPAAKDFITPLTMATLSKKPVYSGFEAKETGEWYSHVDLGNQADAMLIAPATATTMAKAAIGLADNLLLATWLSCPAPVFWSPAMDLDMYKHPATQANVNKLKQMGNHIIDAESGELASGLTGPGRMAEPENIVSILTDFFAKKKA